MKHLAIIAVTGFAMMVLVGCARGASNSPSGSTQRATTAEQTTSIHRIPIEKDKYRGGGLLECRQAGTKGAVFDYARGIGEKASPVELTRSRFSRRIEEGDKVELAERQGDPTTGYYGEELRMVRVVRDGRVVALMFYKQGIDSKEGWLLDSYEACAEF